MTIIDWIKVGLVGAGTVAIVLGYVYALATVTQYYNPYM